MKIFDCFKFFNEYECIQSNDVVILQIGFFNRVLDNLKKKYGVLILRGSLDDDDGNKIGKETNSEAASSAPLRSSTPSKSVSENETYNLLDDDYDDDEYCSTSHRNKGGQLKPREAKFEEGDIVEVLYDEDEEEEEVEVEVDSTTVVDTSGSTTAAVEAVGISCANASEQTKS